MALEVQGSEGGKDYLENGLVELAPGLDSEDPKFVELFGSGGLVEAHH